MLFYSKERGATISASNVRASPFLKSSLPLVYVLFFHIFQVAMKILFLLLKVIICI